MENYFRYDLEKIAIKNSYKCVCFLYVCASIHTIYVILCVFSCDWKVEWNLINESMYMSCNINLQSRSELNKWMRSDLQIRPHVKFKFIIFNI